MVVEDYFSRWTKAFAIFNQEATTMAGKLVDKVFVRFSIPEQLYLNQGCRFEPKLLTEVCCLLIVQKVELLLTIYKAMDLGGRFNRLYLICWQLC